MFADKEVVQASRAFVRVIIRRPHAYWFKQQHSKAPIPGLVFMSAEGKVVDTFPLLVPGQTLEKLRGAMKSHAAGTASPPKTKPKKAIEKKEKATFHVLGMKKTASGAT